MVFNPKGVEDRLPYNRIYQLEDIPKKLTLGGLIGISLILIAACGLSEPSSELPAPTLFYISPQSTATPTSAVSPTATAPSLDQILPPTRSLDKPFLTPTPDPTRIPHPTEPIPEIYVVKVGDSLNGIASRFGVSSSQISNVNGLWNPDILSVGQILSIPTPYPQAPSSNYKIIPDSELVSGPESINFDVEQEIVNGDGALINYRETRGDRVMNAVEIIEEISRRYSVNPRLLIGILEYQYGWLTEKNLPGQAWTYPVGFIANGYEGLYSQLSWAADELNRGYYSWRAGWSGPYLLAYGSVVEPGRGINAGTAALQHFFGQLYPVQVWRKVVEPEGFGAVYERLFGIPFDRAIEPLVPHDLTQPEMQLPFMEGIVWSFTGGPHSAWGNYSGWAALDFAPPGFALGCVRSDEWITAVVDGPVVRVEDGEVIQDLDGDGFEQTGWVVQYLHVEGRDRVEQGTFLQAGDPIGHPSCEGGISSGTHVHLARKFNGEWIPADGPLPFTLDGWVSVGMGSAYDGILQRDGQEIEACACRSPFNQISR